MATRAQVRRAVDAHLEAALATGARRRAEKVFAVSAHFDSRRKRLHIELASGRAVAIPVAEIEGLSSARPAQVKAMVLTGKGYGLHWPALDLDLTVPDLIAGCFGTKAWMRSLARHAGQVKSEAKAAAARANGRKGGRPPKRAATERNGDLRP